MVPTPISPGSASASVRASPRSCAIRTSNRADERTNGMRCGYVTEAGREKPRLLTCSAWG